MRIIGSFLYRIIAFIIKHTPGWNSRRVRVVLVSSNGEILLVRNWLSNQNWTLPGGGIEKGEAPEHAAAREVKEETALTVKPTAMKTIATLYSDALKADLVILRANVSETGLLPLKWRYRLEIMDRAWHHIDSMPPDMSDITKRAIALALGDEN